MIKLTEDQWAKLALDIISYADHDEDCDLYTGRGKCSCNYTATMNRLLDRCQAVVDRAKAVAG